ncbi:MAG: hypothetical protein ACFFAH_15970 [Promethearchaeota archaeon]
MSDKPEDTDDYSIEVESEREKLKNTLAEEETEKEIIEKDFIPHFFPTFRITRNLYPIPIIIAVICAGFLAYATYVLAGIQVEGGYISEEEYGFTAGLINGLIFVLVAALSSFLIIYLVKKYGIGVLKFVFGFSFGFLGFILTYFFAEVISYVIFYNLPESEIVYTSYDIVSYIILFGSGAFIIFMVYKYFTTKSYLTKNFFVLYVGFLVGAMFGVIMPLWTTLAILIGFSIWDIFAVKAKRGPIKQMIDIASQNNLEKGLSKGELKEKIESGEAIYDTSKVEIGIGDLAFYSMLTTSALIITGNLIVMLLTAIAIIIGTGITIQGLRKNKILPGLPISIFLGIGTMLLSWYIVSILTF